MISQPTAVADFLRRAQTKLNEASTGIFFGANNPRLLPSFDRGSDDDADAKNSQDEFKLGDTLGHGSFCEVKEIAAIMLKRPPNAKDRFASSLILPVPKSVRNSDFGISEIDEAGFPTNLFQSKDELRKYMSENFMRRDDDDPREHPRYALKQVRMTTLEQVEQGIIDLSLEAKFLSCMNHPNIIKIRGVAGDPLSPNFGIVLDRLYMTLKEQMDVWTAEKKAANDTGLCACLFGTVDTQAIASLVLSATTVAYDLSCALRHIHSFNLVYRDIKPENAGFDVRGDLKLFDLGFCKELTKKLYDEESGMYKLTQLTGSPPYMAPENFLGKPYGKPVDAFSFGVLVWEMLHCKLAFYGYKFLEYKERVVEGNYRPPINESLTSRVQELIKECWAPDPKKRPPFERICLSLRAAYEEAAKEQGCVDLGGVSRSVRLVDKSVRSFRMHVKRHSSNEMVAFEE